MNKHDDTITIALVGNPNCGKSTLFNALTGAGAVVGNWPGVTVDVKTGTFSYLGRTFTVVDLPGTYALNQPTDNCARDEEIAQCFLANEQIDCIINVVSATNLERHAYLTTQCHDFPIPVIIAVNMIDIATKRNLKLDLHALSQNLNLPVCPISATLCDGISALKQMVIDTLDGPLSREPLFALPDIIDEEVQTLAKHIQHEKPGTEQPVHCAKRLLEGVRCGLGELTPALLAAKLASRQRIESHYQEETDILLIEKRYAFIDKLMPKVVNQAQCLPARRWTDRIDNIFMHRYFGIPSFLLMMYALFFLSVNVGGAFQDFFDLGSEAIFVDGVSQMLAYFKTPEALSLLLAHGVGRGVNTTLTFIPVIASLFFFMGLLEDSGYMSRAAMVMDKGMRKVGLSGKAFVPMLVGFGCNVPAVMAVRTLDNARDRILASMMIPFMSCGARLAIYAVFVAAFFERGGHNIIFALYLLGMLAAGLTAFLLRHTQLQAPTTPFVMELPPYQRPHLPKIIRRTRERLMSFLTRAIKVIVPVCMLLGILNHMTVPNTENTTVIEVVGQTATPLFTPMGITQDNWPATVGLVSGVLAKEVVIGTLNSLYEDNTGSPLGASATDESVQAKLAEALRSIPENLSELGEAVLNPIAATNAGSEAGSHLNTSLAQHFHGQIGAIAYLLFILLYFPCISTVAVLKKEIGARWAWFSMVWSTGLAYMVATNFYQLATFSAHPALSATWIGASLTVLSLFFVWLKRIDISPLTLTTGRQSNAT